MTSLQSQCPNVMIMWRDILKNIDQSLSAFSPNSLKRFRGTDHNSASNIHIENMRRTSTETYVDVWMCPLGPL